MCIRDSDRTLSIARAAGLQRAKVTRPADFHRKTTTLNKNFFDMPALRRLTPTPKGQPGCPTQKSRESTLQCTPASKKKTPVDIVGKAARRHSLPGEQHPHATLSATPTPRDRPNTSPSPVTTNYSHRSHSHARPRTCLLYTSRCV